MFLKWNEMNVESKDIFILEIRKSSNFSKHIEQIFSSTTDLPWF